MYKYIQGREDNSRRLVSSRGHITLNMIVVDELACLALIISSRDADANDSLDAALELS